MKRWLALLLFVFSLGAVAQTKPEILLIQHHIWTVEWVDKTPSCPDSKKVTECVGLTEFKDKKIYIVEDENSPVATLAYLLHEILHAELFEKSNWNISVQDFQYKQSSHDAIYRFTPLMSDALLNNPNLVKYIEECQKNGKMLF
jgi:hypothetical protein